MMNKYFKLFVILLTVKILCVSNVFAKNVLTIAGSTTILPISEKWAKQYKEKTNISVNVHGGGSTGGVIATKIGTADIGASSRELTKIEKIGLTEIIIGKDALAIIVNKNNPVQNLTLDQARGIFVGRIKNWKEVGGPNKPIQIINRESGSGTRDSFEEVVMQITLKDNTKKKTPMSLRGIVSNSNAEVKENIKMIPSSIGYVSVGFVDNSVKALTINSITPSDNNIIQGDYPLVRNLYYLIKNKENKLVQQFVSYILSSEGQSLILKEGFFPIVKVK